MVPPHSRQHRAQRTLPEIPGAIFSVAEVAWYLGTSQTKIRRLVRLRKIPFSRVRGLTRFHREQIDEWIRRTPER